MLDFSQLLQELAFVFSELALFNETVNRVIQRGVQNLTIRASQMLWAAASQLNIGKVRQLVLKLQIVVVRQVAL